MTKNLNFDQFGDDGYENLGHGQKNNQLLARRIYIKVPTIFLAVCIGSQCLSENELTSAFNALIMSVPLRFLKNKTIDALHM